MQVAQFEVDASSMVEMLRALGDSFDEVAPKMLEESAPILAREVETNFPKEITSYISKIKISKPKKAKNGGWVSTINYTDTTKRSKDNLRNAELMAYWEYGSSRNPKTGFMRRSVVGSANSVQDKMVQVLEKELFK